MAATGLTFLQCVNRVLERLRESTVAAYNENTYSTMIAALMNQVKAEIEEAWAWHAMRDTFSVTTVNGTSNYALTSSGMNAQIIDGWNTTTENKLKRGTNAGFNAKFFGTSDPDDGDPTEYLVTGLDSNYDITVDVWPIPDATTNILKFNVYIPQRDLAADATVPLVPQNLLIEETYARALVEKGEEGATPPQPGTTFIRTDLLAAAVSRDQGTDETETDWETE